MATYLRIALIIVSVVLTALVMLQSKGGGLGSMFGSDGSVYQTRRGMEKTMYNMTIVFSIVFLLISLLTVMVGG
ncbi:MAG: preprotein translocase subunit SecG [Caldilineae bacterium]|nr:preprotein translocase subunit SecG [Chloroflexota bacterium]MCB9176453.1 preprotein translocase subunit SecG [Caldilineae bacterium]